VAKNHGPRAFILARTGLESYLVRFDDGQRTRKALTALSRITKTVRALEATQPTEGALKHWRTCASSRETHHCSNGLLTFLSQDIRRLLLLLLPAMARPNRCLLLNLTRPPPTPEGIDRPGNRVLSNHPRKKVTRKGELKIISVFSSFLLSLKTPGNAPPRIEISSALIRKIY